MIKTVYAIAAAAIVAGAFVAAPSLAAQVEARGPVPGAKSDRADTRPLAKECSQRAWPYFEAACLRDARNPLRTGARGADRLGGSPAPARASSAQLTRRFDALLSVHVSVLIPLLRI